MEVSDQKKREVALEEALRSEGKAKTAEKEFVDEHLARAVVFRAMAEDYA